MKSLVILAASLLVAGAAFGAKPEMKCTNGEETTVEVYAVGTKYRADVTVQSVGDSYPTFHYKNVELVQQPHNFVGAPRVYQSKEFTLKVIVDAAERPGYLTVPAIGLNNEKLDCR